VLVGPDECLFLEFLDVFHIVDMLRMASDTFLLLNKLNLRAGTNHFVALKGTQHPTVNIILLALLGSKSVFFLLLVGCIDLFHFLRRLDLKINVLLCNGGKWCIFAHVAFVNRLEVLFEGLTLRPLGLVHLHILQLVCES